MKCSLLLASLVLCSSSLAQSPPRVAVCASEPASDTCRIADVRGKLLATGQFALVDTFNTTVATPTLAQLQGYDAVLVWNNVAPANNNALGDVLADYVDSGGGVVSAVFAAANTGGFGIGGRWMQGYEVALGNGDMLWGVHATLGTVLVPAHPVMAGVAAFDGGGISARPNNATLAAGATLLATWSNGNVLVAEGARPNRVDLGFYPPSSSCSASLWSSATDGARLMANALMHVANACEVPGLGYCTSGTSSNGCSATLSASGAPRVSATSGFVLTCANLDGQRSGLILYGITGRDSTPWASGSTSFSCVRAPRQRTPTSATGGTAGQCDGTIAIDLLAFFAANPNAFGQPVHSGQRFDVQAVWRDPSAPGASQLSSGLEFLACP